MPRLLEICRTATNAGVHSWADIQRVDLRPSKGILTRTPSPRPPTTAFLRAIRNASGRQRCLSYI